VAKISKTQKLVQALKKGQKLTVGQIQTRCGFQTPNSAFAAVAHLKRDGVAIRAAKTKAGQNQYYLPTR
jgi:hypothetical protein